MNGEVLVDTNVLTYAFDADEPRKRDLARSLIDELTTSGRICVSSQVLGEFFSVSTRKLAPPLEASDAAEHVRSFSQVFRVYDGGVAVVLEALRGVVRYQMSFYDAQVWAVARLNHVPVILTEDFSHGSEIEGVRFHDPFTEPFAL